MKKLSKLVYLFVALAVMSSCEQDTIESEALNRSNEIEALIQEHDFLSDAIEIGIDVESYIISIMNETPEADISFRPGDEKPYRNYVYIGECGTMIDNDDRKDVYNMQDDIMYLMYEICYYMYMPRRPWERPFDAERAFRKEMYYMAMRWAVRGQCSWSEAADIMACVGDSGIDFENYCDEVPT